MTDQMEMTGTEVARVEDAAPAVTEDAPEFGSLVELAIREKVDVGVIERLVALQERVTERGARAAYFDALAAFQEAVTEIPKSKRVQYVTNSGTTVDYHYAPLEEITRVIRTPLREHGLSYAWDVQSLDAGQMVVACVLRHVDGHEARATFPVPVDSRAKMSAAQAHGAALTYGKRQSLIAVLGLTTAEDDVDGRTPIEAPDPITDEEAAGLDDMADEAGVDKAAFCRWLGVPSIAEIPAHQYADARAALERKLAEKRGAS